MWQPSWSPHPPPGAHGAPLGPPAGTVAPPPQGVQPHTMVVAQPMNQQWMGNPAGSQGCPGNPSTLAPPPFYGPGPQGQSFVVQCKHHQGSYSIMQHHNQCWVLPHPALLHPWVLALAPNKQDIKELRGHLFLRPLLYLNKFHNLHWIPPPTHRDTTHCCHLHLNLPRLPTSHPSRTNPSSTNQNHASKPTYL